MCLEHASAIDEPHSITHYPKELLFEWKKRQLEQYAELEQGWHLSSQMAKRVLDMSKSAEVQLVAEEVHLGGQGGSAPGAGGGGGGAIGRNARGGKGGSGGKDLVMEGYQPSPVAEAFFEASELASSAGAGAGGAGAIGENARGGDGGNGGDSLRGQIVAEDFRKAGWNGLLEIQIGAAGVCGNQPGEHGRPGGDASISLSSFDGTLLESIRVKGAMGARSGASYPPDGTVELSEYELNNFDVVCLLPFNAADIRDGLFYSLGAGWCKYKVHHIPSSISWNMMLAVSFDPILDQMPRSLALSLHDPSGIETSCVALHIGPEVLEIGHALWLLQIGATFDGAGCWTVCVCSGSKIIARMRVQVYT